LLEHLGQSAPNRPSVSSSAASSETVIEYLADDAETKSTICAASIALAMIAAPAFRDHTSEIVTDALRKPDLLRFAPGSNAIKNNLARLLARQPAVILHNRCPLGIAFEDILLGHWCHRFGRHSFTILLIVLGRITS
jgi:hypothetical protein